MAPAHALYFGALATSVALAASVAACGSGGDDPNGGRTAGTPSPSAAPAPPTTEQQIQKILDERKFDYGEALRTASLKLRDRLPELAEIKQIESAAGDAGKKSAYEALVDTMIDSPDFARTMVKFWRDTFRIAQIGDVQNSVDRDAAPIFAAQVTVESRSYTELFTAAANTCPTFDPKTSSFTAASCQQAKDAIAGAPTVGVLTDPGIQGQYFANMAFRRVRFIQETFVCSKFPAEFSASPVPMGNGVYTGLMPFASISGSDNNPSARVDFHETKAVVCANCHINLNHLAPLFINYDANGALRDKPQVKVPVPNEPTAQRSDYLPDGESLAWRNGKPVTDIASLGQTMAADPDVARCAVNRVWNYAMSRGDIVADQAPVPTPVTQPLVDKFVASGMKLKETIRDVFKTEDFTKF